MYKNHNFTSISINKFYLLLKIQTPHQSLQVRPGCFLYWEVERSTSYRKLEKRKTQIAFLIAKQRKAPPSPSSLGLWSTSSSNSPIRKIKSMPRSRLEFPRPVS
ncbi:unnamed protein product [Rhizophagus irregularis]|uniref:Uncharacterized protein n=1 Tax=Rhizophagus irregularis TaxID=588596 RepID=A0A915YQJ8_9GLOM|nr:unnamed protein product [Rhizophagus irregularis]CAB5312609.1 unnamed protein product [Rhizophagus irregularis]